VTARTHSSRGRRPRAHGRGGRAGTRGRSPLDTTCERPDLERLERATATLEPPFAVVDLDALWANAADLERRAAPKPIRLASKSVRCRALQERVLERPGFAGTLAYTLPEALWLAGHGFEDILVAYPTTDRRALRRLVRLGAERPLARVTVMVDSAAHLDLLERALEECGAPDAAAPPSSFPASACAFTQAAPPPAPPGRSLVQAAPAAPLRVCLELDTGLWAARGRVRIGARRSPLHTPEQALLLARDVCARPHLRLVGVMAYEALIAGLGDAAPHGGLPARARALAVRLLQATSARELAPRRAAAVAAVRAVAALEFVNGGGTGSLHLTSREDAVTEVAAGSGLYGPGLFDAYRAFRPRPAALFALPVMRRPGPGVATVLGGGYLASGPLDRARLPRPHLPSGLRLDPREGAGEVQTPLLGSRADTLAVGDRVWLRHAKAGELCEHFNTLHLLAGDRLVEEVPTYRGEGHCFL
jgi:D-serine deaminase-like pyridoxal phosphate-dependent protein